MSEFLFKHTRNQENFKISSSKMVMKKVLQNRFETVPTVLQTFK